MGRCSCSAESHRLHDDRQLLKLQKLAVGCKGNVKGGYFSAKGAGATRALKIKPAAGNNSVLHHSVLD